MPECCGQAIEISDETELFLPVPWSCGHYVVELYNEIRTHLALSKSLLLSRAVQRSGAIVAITILSGLHPHYVRDIIFGKDTCLWIEIGDCRIGQLL